MHRRCHGDPADFDPATDQLLDTAEAALPDIADALDARIVEADRRIETTGGTERTNVTASSDDGTGSSVANTTVKGVSAADFVLTPEDFDAYQSSDHREFDQVLVTPLDQ